MKLDLIATMTIAIMRVENRGILIRGDGPFHRLRAARYVAELVQLFAGPARAFPRHTLPQRTVAGEQIHVDERRCLIENLVRHVMYLNNECDRSPYCYCYWSVFLSRTRLTLRKSMRWLR